MVIFSKLLILFLDTVPKINLILVSYFKKKKTRIKTQTRLYNLTISFFLSNKQNMNEVESLMIIQKQASDEETLGRVNNVPVKAFHCHSSDSNAC